MSAPDVILPGFYGKLPSAGDFVTRRLPLSFVTPWDRWLARHMVPLIGEEGWREPLRFLSGPAAFGSAAGIVLPSQDRAGRRFPLSIVALLHEAEIGLVRFAARWFLAIEGVGGAARQGELTPDELDRELLGLGLPARDPSAERQEDEIIDGFVLWTANSDIYDLDIDEPALVLDQIAAAHREVG